MSSSFGDTHVSTLLEELCQRAGGIRPEEVDHFHRLVAVWQMLADLSFADLLLVTPIQDSPDGDMIVLAQTRPDSTQTLFPDDHVGTALVAENAQEARTALETGKPQRGAADGRGVLRVAVPVRVGDRIPAVLVREGMPFGGRRVSSLEEAYQQCAETLHRMIVEGVFPYPGMQEWGSPRVSDGLLQLAPSGLILFASPNATAAHRRLGVYTQLVGTNVSDLPGGKALSAALEGQVPLEAEVEMGGAVVSRRVVPFVVAGELLGGIVLVQDVTELRRRDRMLMYKDAVIREIHHRVKNNLQTIASLLRLQSRRLGSDEAREALEESVRRVSTIALVHETLSQASGDLVDFGEVLRGVVRMLQDGLGLDQRRIGCEVRGEVGELPAVVATPLSLVITELVQNAAEHAFEDREEGTISVGLERTNGTVRATVADDGIGLPDDFSWESGGLGLKIVSALVDHELKGSLEVEAGEGTRIHVRVPLPGYRET
ncbi:MAG TPA: sensor histidine kinase [Actinomycetota bacterium]|nr:sensor histidine kinase [Actinomycetota bacterium]